jgi:hypothetical protein
MKPSMSLVVVAALLARPATIGAADVQTVALVVTDASGSFVADLDESQLAVFENGEPREILGLERDERPLALAVVLDTSESVEGVYRLQVAEAVGGFLDGLPERSRFTVWVTGERPQRVLEQGGKTPPQQALLKVFLMGGNMLIDALVEAAERLEGQPGRRRAIVAVTGAGPGYASFTPSECVKRVSQARARVLGAIFHEGEGRPVDIAPGHGAGAEASRVGYGEHEYVLNGLAKATGGRFESLPSSISLAQTLRSFSADLQGQYRLRYATVRDRGARNVQVQVTRPGLRWRVVVDSP